MHQLLARAEPIPAGLSSCTRQNLYDSAGELYDLLVAIMSVSEVRGRLAEAIERAHGEPITVSRRGRRQVALVDPEHFDRLTEAAEDLADITAFDEAMAEAGDNIPWEQVKADLGRA